MHLYAILKLLKTFDSPWIRGVVSKWWDVLYDAQIAGPPEETTTLADSQN